MANPFYHYLTQTLFPGPLYNQQTVSLGSLLVPYPQYGGLYELGRAGRRRALQLVRVEGAEAFSKGYNFLVSYVYIREKAQTNVPERQLFNDQQWYSTTSRIRTATSRTTASTSRAPGNCRSGRAAASRMHMPKAADAVVGGWKLAGLWTFISGDFPQFGNLIVTGNPCISNPTPQHWFNTAAFSQIPANTYVLRTNPLQYGCLTGPQFWNVDANLAKSLQHHREGSMRNSRWRLTTPPTG